MSNLGILDFGTFVAVPEEEDDQAFMQAHIDPLLEEADDPYQFEPNQGSLRDGGFVEQVDGQPVKFSSAQVIPETVQTAPPPVSPEVAGAPTAQPAQPVPQPTPASQAQAPQPASSDVDAISGGAFEQPVDPYVQPQPIDPYAQAQKAVKEDEDMRLIDGMAASAAIATGSPAVGQMFKEIQKRNINAARMDQYGSDLQAAGALRTAKYTSAAEKDKAAANTGMEEAIAENYRTNVKPQLDARFEQLFSVMQKMDSFEFDANRVWNNKDTVDRALTILGAGLGGLLNASFGQPSAPNSVINAYQQAVETDLAEQKLNFNKLIDQATNARADIQQIDAMREAFNGQLDMERVLRLKAIDSGLAAKIADNATPLVTKGGLMKQRAAIQNELNKKLMESAEKIYGSAQRYNELRLQAMARAKQQGNGTGKNPEEGVVLGDRQINVGRLGVTVGGQGIITIPQGSTSTPVEIAGKLASATRTAALIKKILDLDEGIGRHLPSNEKRALAEQYAKTAQAIQIMTGGRAISDKDMAVIREAAGTGDIGKIWAWTSESTRRKLLEESFNEELNNVETVLGPLVVGEILVQPRFATSSDAGAASKAAGMRTKILENIDKSIARGGEGAVDVFEAINTSKGFGDRNAFVEPKEAAKMRAKLTSLKTLALAEAAGRGASEEEVKSIVMKADEALKYLKPQKKEEKGRDPEKMGATKKETAVGTMYESPQKL